MMTQPLLARHGGDDTDTRKKKGFENRRCGVTRHCSGCSTRPARRASCCTLTTSGESARNWYRRLVGKEAELSRQEVWLARGICCFVVLCVASAVAVAVFLLTRRPVPAYRSCTSEYCREANAMMPVAKDASEPCDDFYDHVCRPYKDQHIRFTEAVRALHKGEYHEHMLSMPNATARGNVTLMLAFDHQICAGFSHKQVRRLAIRR
ncbi:uncharacterized protein LOC144141688 [Haemaphysalis longicornis]